MYFDLLISGNNGVYDNTPGQLKGDGKKDTGVEEDIYGGVVGGNGEGIYDTAGGGRKGMKYTDDGIYDNPLTAKGSCVAVDRLLHVECNITGDLRFGRDDL